MLDSTVQSLSSLNDIKFLLKQSESARDSGELTARNIYLKLSIVSLVSKLQVFVENTMNEYVYKLRANGILYSSRSDYNKCLLIKNIISSRLFENNLKNKQNYNSSFYAEIISEVNKLNLVISATSIVDENYIINTKFPLGKTGTNEIRDLIIQLEGVDIFDKYGIDLGLIDSLLNLRHNIIHQDINPGLTEFQVNGYVKMVKKIIHIINNYVYSKI